MSLINSYNRRLSGIPKATIGIIGAGPSGLFAALRLASLGISDIILIDQGDWPSNRLCPHIYSSFQKVCPPCSIHSGIGGSALVNPIRLSLAPAGTGLQKLLGERYFLLEEQVLSVWAFLTGLDLNLSVSSQFKKKHQLSDNLLEKFYPSISLSLDKVKIALDSILSILVNLNVRIIPKKKVSQLERFDSYWLIRCEDNFWFTSSYVVLATGKEGTYFLQQHIEQFQLSSFRRGLEIGARLEFPIHSMTFQGTSHDRKILWKPSSFSGEEVRTFCWTFPGKSILCRYGDLYCIDGLEDSSSDFWSFGLMVRQKEISAEERRRNVDELTKRQHSIFKGMPVAQKLDSFLQRESNIGEPDCSLQHFIQGNVEDLLGQTISSRLRETIFVLMEHQIIPKIISGCTIIAPCLGVWSDILHLNDDLETSAPNLFAVGDCVGSYRGSFQASLAGWVVGESIAQKIKCQNH